MGGFHGGWSTPRPIGYAQVNLPRWLCISHLPAQEIDVLPRLLTNVDDSKELPALPIRIGVLRSKFCRLERQTLAVSSTSVTKVLPARRDIFKQANSRRPPLKRNAKKPQKRDHDCQETSSWLADLRSPSQGQRQHLLMNCGPECASVARSFLKCFDLVHRQVLMFHIRSGTVSESTRSSGQWAFVDIGFASGRRT